MRVPGSTSNLSAGLDAIGLAINLYSHVTLEVLSQGEMRSKRVTLKGSGPPLSRMKDNSDLVYQTFAALWKSDRELLSRLRLTVDSEIPLGCGLGGFAASTVACYWLSCLIQDVLPSTSELLSRCVDLGCLVEYAAASLTGQMVVCGSGTGGGVVLQQIAWPERWKMLVVLPSYRLDTADARAVLPKTVPIEDAVFNVQRAALLVAAVCRQDEVAMASALQDRLHEKYRADLVPDLADLRAALAGEPVMGVCLSGAGSALVVFFHERHKERVGERVRSWCRSRPDYPELFELSVATEGVVLESDELEPLA